MLIHLCIREPGSRNLDTSMSDLALYQYVLIGLIFIWSGFVRSGLGFGGAVLSLPFLLLVLDDPLKFNCTSGGTRHQMTCARTILAR